MKCGFDQGAVRTRGGAHEVAVTPGTGASTHFDTFSIRLLYSLIPNGEKWSSRYAYEAAAIPFGNYVQQAELPTCANLL